MEPTWRRWGSGNFPKFGAIFMSNKETRQECFDRSLFALPHTYAEFVREVKAGMVLFLFDHQLKKLYGVFEAVSDGGLNIVPNSFTSSQMYFPAQVRFRNIWKCYPLRQHEFQDVIRDNYYTEYKFNFGLSKDQVQSLLYLFETRRVRIKKSPSEGNINHIHMDYSDASINEKNSVEPLALEEPLEIEEPLELGDFIPLFSPESSPLSSSQSSPCPSKDQDLPEHHPEVKGLYSDHIGERKSVFVRLEESAKSTTDETQDSDVERNRSCADDVTTEEVMENLLRRQKSWMTKLQTGTSHVRRKRETPRVGSVFSRLNFNSERNRQESDTFEEKENKRGRGLCDKSVKNRLTFPVEMFDKGGEAVDYTKLFCTDMEGRLWIVPRV